MYLFATSGSCSGSADLFPVLQTLSTGHRAGWSSDRARGRCALSCHCKQWARGGRDWPSAQDANLISKGHAPRSWTPRQWKQQTQPSTEAAPACSLHTSALRPPCTDVRAGRCGGRSWHRAGRAHPRQCAVPGALTGQ